ncbi:D-sedoheptulose 7-phosphate isomerase [Piscinibacter sp. Jin2]|uniref:Phosphoheptose isomerase n=1 Tax=Aquariibacter lacus TaxID=2801332 RepID=A0A9X0XES4_9BURK|nr:D-sedoheptulose 7-phosphate isomerase [Piscinibacter lacus]MBL0718633.1 D-sedoheptulose 7-phosphate isomerase [Piscinibacter lacus]
MTDLLIRNLDEHRELFARLDALAPEVQAAGRLMAEALRRGRKIMFCGNGGSAADSQHLAAELTGRFIHDRKPLAAMALSTDSSALTCIGNDYSFAEVFSRQVEGLGQAGDVLVGISTSGRSANVIKAVEAALGRDMQVIGLLGRDGGALKALCDVAIVVPSPTTARIQEAHILIGHTLCGLIEEQFGVGLSPA